MPELLLKDAHALLELALELVLVRQAHHHHCPAYYWAYYMPVWITAQARILSDIRCSVVLLHFCSPLSLAESALAAAQGFVAADETAIVIVVFAAPNSSQLSCQGSHVTCTTL